VQVIVVAQDIVVIVSSVAQVDLYLFDRVAKVGLAGAEERLSSISMKIGRDDLNASQQRKRISRARASENSDISRR
jgi:hypothetical protein